MILRMLIMAISDQRCMVQKNSELGPKVAGMSFKKWLQELERSVCKRCCEWKISLAAVLMFSGGAAQAQTLEQLIQAGVIPKTPSMALTRKPLLDRVQQGDLQVSVFLSRRKAGTRTPIHEHPYGGIDCLLEGEATLYFDNQKPRVYRAPMCVHMPPGVRMINVASTQQDTLFYDIFFGPKGFAYWHVDEKGVAPSIIHDFERHLHGH